MNNLDIMKWDVTVLLRKSQEKSFDIMNYRMHKKEVRYCNYSIFLYRTSAGTIYFIIMK